MWDHFDESTIFEKGGNDFIWFGFQRCNFIDFIPESLETLLLWPVAEGGGIEEGQWVIYTLQEEEKIEEDQQCIDDSLPLLTFHLIAFNIRAQYQHGQRTWIKKQAHSWRVYTLWASHLSISLPTMLHITCEGSISLDQCFQVFGIH